MVPVTKPTQLNEKRLPIATFCPICLGQFANGRLRNEHLKQHGRAPFFCGCCERPFHNDDDLLDHFRSHSTLKHLSCGGVLGIACDEAFSNKPALRKHALRTHPERINELSKTSDVRTPSIFNALVFAWLRLQAAIRFRNAAIRSCPPAQLYAKDDSYIRKRPHKCASWGHRYTNRRLLAKHTRLFHGKREVQRCDKCSYATPDLQYFRQHMSAHAQREQMDNERLCFNVRDGNLENVNCNICRESVVNLYSHIILMSESDKAHADCYRHVLEPLNVSFD